MSYWYLVIAIIMEVIATSALKASNEFTKLLPSLVVILGYAISFYFMTLALRTIAVGIAYAIWSGVGIILVAIVSIFLYKQIPNIPTIIGMCLIVLGIILVYVFSKPVA